jgi:hypothetical protein
MFTSCFARLKTISAGLEPVGISRGIPRWFKGRRELRLAPSWAMLQQMTKAEYDDHFARLLAKLDPRELYDSLGANAVLLCWEAPGVRCHRRRAAEWFEESLGVKVPEVGFKRSQCACYSELPPKPGRRP